MRANEKERKVGCSAAIAICNLDSWPLTHLDDRPLNIGEPMAGRELPGPAGFERGAFLLRWLSENAAKLKGRRIFPALSWASTELTPEPRFPWAAKWFEIGSHLLPAVDARRLAGPG